MSYSERVAAEIRKANAKEWASKVVDSYKFVGLGLEEKTIYWMANIRKSAFTITDGSTGLIIDCETIAEALAAFKRETEKKLASDYWKVAA